MGCVCEVPNVVLGEDGLVLFWGFGSGSVSKSSDKPAVVFFVEVCGVRWFDVPREGLTKSVWVVEV